jgi:isopenicillin-N N-acyltransferase-like protein
VAILRDKRGPGSTELPLGHRSAIDALIATHSVLMDTTARILWVSEGPHATGRFVEFDLAELLDLSYSPPETSEPVEALPADPIVADGRFQAWVAGGSIHPGVE